MSRYYQSRNYNEAPAQKQSYGGTSYGKTNTSQNYGASQNYGRGGRKENDEERLMRSLFSTFDNDGDGHISQPEFLKMLSSLGYTISSHEVTQLVNSFDQNGDGEMDFTEFMNMVKYLKSKGYEYGKEALENKIRKAFSVLDANQDGYLSRAELRYVLCNTGNRLSPAEFEDFLKTFDLDNDGHVSCEEYIKIACSSLIDYMDEIVRMKAR
ncbi:1803520Bcalmodulin 1 [Paramuricea clavata]|uniref:1803520Bcalmodulin 1 n=1 Tax=Paramuricea clavata TaxID=317549 RepID=A0A6S7H117_PARCT|nr:1803520Bcalmodulin 1 [Paramuricea clavata]